MSETALQRRTRRALERQLYHQQLKAEALRGHEAEFMIGRARETAAIRSHIDSLRPISADARVLEVGSGAHGHIFFFNARERVGVDPLAEEYRSLFSAWQGRTKTLAAFGEALPFEDSSFDIVLCDNVVDHAEDPQRIVEEIARVLVPGGILYFTVNVHHPFYHFASTVHAGWRALGVPIEIRPFADHTVHLTPKAARRLLAPVPLRILSENAPIREARRAARETPPRHPGDRIKRIFYKNANWQVIAVKEGELARSSPAA
jgi:SAM-dependent methyltransferase